MKILLINKFLYPKGGAETSTLATGELFAERGHQVCYWGMDHPANPPYPHRQDFVSRVDYNNRISVFEQCRGALNILYSFEARHKIKSLLDKVRPDVIHLNNIAHQISPSILDVIKAYGIPTVMTLHDYKLVCPAYMMISHGKPCEKCGGGRYYWCVLNRCTKESCRKSLLNALEMYLHHKLLHICGKIDLFIAPSRFLQQKVRDMGFGADMEYLPNFVDTDRVEPCYDNDGKSIAYVGRLSGEKGVETLIDAVSGQDTILNLFGDGPERVALETRVKAGGINNVIFRGHETGNALFEAIRRSMFIVAPSLYYENNPRAVLEAFALGKPVVGSRIGGIPELVRDGESGVTFEAGNKVDLRDKLARLLHDRNEIIRLGRNARAFVEKEFNPERHYGQLMAVYKKAAAKG